MTEKNKFYNLSPLIKKLFDRDIELLPSVNELFELELAYLEYNCLPEDSLLDRLAYFKSIEGNLTKHFLMYNQSVKPVTNNRSVSTRTYFENGAFSTGYATHGLFPYRGKFHPQLIKSLINIIGIRKGEVILDPMCGSGTTNIEASLMGIDSYAIDLSPFCQFMTKVKYNSLFIDIDLLKGISNKSEELFTFFNTDDINKQLQKITDNKKLKVYQLALLSFLDALVSCHSNKFVQYVFMRYQQLVWLFGSSLRFLPLQPSTYNV